MNELRVFIPGEPCAQGRPAFPQRGALLGRMIQPKAETIRHM